MMLQDGTYFEGALHNNKRHGPNCYVLYENGEEYFGEYAHDKRVGRGKLIMEDNAKYEGQFINDCADGIGHIEDGEDNLY